MHHESNPGEMIALLSSVSGIGGLIIVGSDEAEHWLNVTVLNG